MKSMLCRKLYALFLVASVFFCQQSFSQATVVRPLLNFGEGQESSPGISIIYFSLGRAAITAPNYTGQSFGFNDENPDSPRRIEGVLIAPTQNIMTEYEIGIVDIHTKSNFVIDLFQYAWGRNQNKNYRYDRISTGMGFQLNLGRKVWLRQVNYVGIDWLGNILLDDIPVSGGISGNLWLNDKVYSEDINLRLLIRQTQISYRPQISLGLKFSEGFLLSINAGYNIPFQRDDPRIILKAKSSSESEEFSRIFLNADRINLRDLNTNAPIEASSFQLNRWYVSARLAVHILGD